MAKKKYYAVKNGVKPGIYENWDDCKEQVNGFNGAVYKSFTTFDDANKFMMDNIDSSVKDDVMDVNEFNNRVDEKIGNLSFGECMAFVDGSYNTVSNSAGYGSIIFCSNNVVDQLFKSFTVNYSKEIIELRNVSAELEAVKDTIMWAIENKKKKITIYYDYIGIEKWYTGEWQANKNLTKKYVSFMNLNDHLLQVREK